MAEFQTLKTNLIKTRLVDTNFAEVNFQPGEILAKIDRFAFTANNVTYGVAGDTIGYWQFFPASENPNNEWGCLPVWGFAEIRDSNVEGLEIGERIFGYFPPASNLILNPVKVSAQRFIDGKKHRSELPPVYNNYIRMSGEENYDSAMDNIRSLLFPLHITSFCLCDALQDESYLGASQIIVISASSKTAIGLAQGLADDDNAPKIIGLTSKNNSRFVEELGCYDQIICYDQLETVDTNAATVMVDMAGNRAVLGTLHGALGESMLKCMTVGMTHWDNATTADDPLGQQMIRERTEFFFAPTRIQKRVNDWGQDGYNDRSNKFMGRRAAQSKDWMKVKEISGLESFTGIYNEIVAGNIHPDEGIIVLV